MCKDACNCERGRANIDRLFCKCNHNSIPEPSGYSHGMATFYFLTNLVSLCARGTVVGREGGWSACSQASGLMALTFSLFFIFRISALKKQKSNDRTHQEELKSQSITVTFRGLPFLWWELPSRASGAPLTRPIYATRKWPIYMWDLCQVLTCGRLANAKMGSSMDKKEVNSSNFTFKNLYKPLEACGPF